jgi:glucose/mannose-6-phosphate isomerase
MAEIQNLKNKLDSKNMHGLIAAMPEHLEDGMAVGNAANLSGLKPSNVEVILVAGMGGSAIAGDIARSFLSDEIRVPLLVVRNYRLPAFAGKSALVICSSYSGNTEETLAAYDDAKSKGAQILAITSGGTLAQKAQTDNVPVASIKGGLPPRAALGYSFATLLTLLSRLGFCDDHSAELKDTIESLKSNIGKYGLEAKDNPAIDLASYFHGCLPIIYAGCEKLEAIATRFRGQINENAKTLAFTNFFPELNHNEIVGWHILHGLDDKFRILILEDQDDHKRIKARIEIVGEYLSQKGFGEKILDSEGKSPLERIFNLIQLLDFTSYFLSLLNGVDPYPVAAIDYLKDRLAKMN